MKQRFNKDFVPLHLQSDYSFISTLNSLDTLLEFGKQEHYQSMALTDRGNLHGSLKFYRKALDDFGIKPIIGMEIPIGIPSSPSTRLYPVLLALNNRGFKKLVTLSTKLAGNLETLTLEEGILTNQEDVVLLCGGASGLFSTPLLDETEKFAQANLLKELFGENFYLEIFYHGLEHEKIHNRQTIEMGEKLGISIVATAPGRYHRVEDQRFYQLLRSSYLSNKEDLGQYHLKTWQELSHLYRSKPKFLTNSYEISTKLTLDLKFDKVHLPKYPLPADFDDKTFLRKLLRDKLPPRKANVSDPYAQRMEHELAIIEKLGLSSYFLIIWDIIREAKRKNQITGPGRGSACGSLVSYLLGITDIDPLEHNLVFERFLNPERRGLPDIDVDISHLHRNDILRYLASRYEKETVAQIVSFNTFRAKASLREAARLLNVRGTDLETLIRKIGNSDEQLRKAFSRSTDSSTKRLMTGELEDVVKLSQQLLGLVRSTSLHAAGTVIIPEELQPLIPTMTREDTPLPVAAFDMKDLEKVGLVKIDLLSVKTLTVIADTLKKAGLTANFRELDLNFSEVYREISRGNTFGVFQLESSGMRKFLRELQPVAFTELVDGLALYRPGPLGSGMVRAYTHRESMDLPESIRGILASTRGVLIYQEQVMEIAKEIGGFSLSKADILREAMSKKRHFLMETLQTGFIEGAKEKGFSEDEAHRIFSMLSKFGEYGFNKSHAAAYAQLSYLTMFLKIQHPAHYLAAIMNNEVGNTQRIEEAVAEALRLDVRVRPPSVNGPYREFRSTRQTLTFPLTAIKGIGEQHVQLLSECKPENRKFQQVEQCIAATRKNQRLSQILPILIKAGALDCFGLSRSGLLLHLDGLDMEAVRNMKEFSETVIRQDELEYLGVHLTQITPNLTPLLYQFISVVDFPSPDILPENHQCLLLGKFRYRDQSRVEFHYRDKQKTLSLDEKLPPLEHSGMYVAKIVNQLGQLLVTNIKPAEEVPDTSNLMLTIPTDCETENQSLLKAVFNILRDHPGSSTLSLRIQKDSQNTTVINSPLKLSLTERFLARLEAFSEHLTIEIDPFPEDN